MFLDMYNSMVTFLEGNIILVSLIIIIVEYLKRWLKPITWYKDWMTTALAFIIGFTMVIPSTGFATVDWFDLIAQGFGLGLVATGVYKVGSTLSRKSIYPAPKKTTKKK